jgi:hypothetical protein
MSEEEEVLNEGLELAKKVFTELYNKAASNPTILYRGVPLVILLYMTGPLIFTLWEWGPWLWMLYGLYRTLPRNLVVSTLEKVKDIIKTQTGNTPEE